MIIINFEKAKEIRKGQINTDSLPLIEALDKQLVEVVEQGGDTSGILAEKQRIKNIMQLIDNAQSIEELKAITV